MKPNCERVLVFSFLQAEFQAVYSAAELPAELAEELSSDSAEHLAQLTLRVFQQIGVLAQF